MLRSDLTAAVLRDRFDYDAASGIFKWKQNAGGRVKGGDVAGCKSDIFDTKEEAHAAYLAAAARLHGDFAAADNDFEGRLGSLYSRAMALVASSTSPLPHNSDFGFINGYN